MITRPFTLIMLCLISMLSTPLINGQEEPLPQLKIELMNFDPQDPHQREALISQVLPDSEEAMLDLMRNLGVRVTPKEGLVAFFIIVAAPSLSQLEAAYEAEKMTHKQAFSLQHTETIDRFIERHDSGLYRLIEVAFFAGSDNDILEAVRTAVDGAFYADGSY